MKNLSEIAQPLAEKAQAKAGADAGGDGFTDAANAGAEDADVVDGIVVWLISKSMSSCHGQLKDKLKYTKEVIRIRIRTM